MRGEEEQKEEMSRGHLKSRQPIGADLTDCLWLVYRTWPEAWRESWLEKLSSSAPIRSCFLTSKHLMSQKRGLKIFLFKKMEGHISGWQDLDKGHAHTSPPPVALLEWTTPLVPFEGPSIIPYPETEDEEISLLCPLGDPIPSESPPESDLSFRWEVLSSSAGLNSWDMFMTAALLALESSKVILNNKITKMTMMISIITESHENLK